MIRRIDEESVVELAAAQVIIDLATAVKELVENSLDAGASQITVSFSDYGLDWVEVSDDGHGIAAEDIEMIGKRHHTSKITLHEEIFKVRSFGFRGEALHSLTILSGEVVVTSKTQSQPTGTQVTFTNCAVKTATIACNKGTTVRIRGLLQNLPVRLAEWKRNSKRHFSHCVWLLQSYILAVTDVRFRCTNVSTTTTQTLFVSSGSGDTSKSYAEAFKGELKQKLLDVAVETARFGGKLYYCLSGRKSNDRQFCFMNQRPCDLPKVLKKLNEVCKSYAIEGAAILVLYITSNGLIDTNLTPDKRQVAITFEAELVDCICSAFASKLSAGREIERPQTLAAPPPRSLPAGVQEATSVSTYIPPLPYSLAGSSQGPVAACSEISLELSSSSEPVTIPHACTHFDVTLETQNNRILDRGDFEKMKILGQFNCGFILTSIRQGDDKNLVFIIDQHASDERYRLEKLQRELTFNVQTMFIPRRLYLGLEDQLYVSSNLERVKSQGFLVAIVETSELDERIFHLLSAPTVVGIQCNDKDFGEMIELMKADEYLGLYCLSRIAEILASKACRSAIMIGDALNQSQMEQVVRNLSGLQKPWICAHGRPTVRLLYTDR